MVTKNLIVTLVLLLLVLTLTSCTTSDHITGGFPIAGEQGSFPSSEIDPAEASKENTTLENTQKDNLITTQAGKS